MGVYHVELGYNVFTHGSLPPSGFRVLLIRSSSYKELLKIKIISKQEGIRPLL